MLQALLENTPRRCVGGRGRDLARGQASVRAASKQGASSWRSTLRRYCGLFGSVPVGVTRLYSPAIQRGMSTLYHCEKRFSLGPPGRFVQASSVPMSVTKWYVGAKVVSRVAVVIKWP